MERHKQQSKKQSTQYAKSLVETCMKRENKIIINTFLLYIITYTTFTPHFKGKRRCINGIYHCQNGIDIC